MSVVHPVHSHLYDENSNPISQKQWSNYFTIKVWASRSGSSSTTSTHVCFMYGPQLRLEHTLHSVCLTSFRLKINASKAILTMPNWQLKDEKWPEPIRIYQQIISDCLDLFTHAHMYASFYVHMHTQTWWGR